MRDIIEDVILSLKKSKEKAINAGVLPKNIIIDPGIGFGKTLEHNLKVLSCLKKIRAHLKLPLLLGTSRKSFIGEILGGLPVHERLEGTAATVALGIAQGADMVRVHDVKEMVRVARVSDAILRNTTA
ncbi:dihydropteroate synthase [Patescibacteria group bacterium]|nr:dihydropteroate synthase [Patescibacteria group bacterium]